MNGRPECIVCGSAAVAEFLDLGETALANKFRSEQELSTPELFFPLKVGFCHDCGHVQLTEHVPPSAMFEDYLYISSASETLKQHLHELSDVVVRRLDMQSEDLVVDIGCNDGTLLRGFERHGVRTLGVDPAQNLASFTDGSGIDRYVGFFGAGTAPEIVDRWGHATAATATNTFPHIPNLHDFVVGLDTLLAPGGTFVIEAHYLLDMLEQGAFDTVYHEHVSYWALGPMMNLFGQHDMQVVRAERLPIHHGQLRATVQRNGEGEVHPSVGEMLEQEEAAGLREFDTFKRFAAKTQKIKSELHDTVRALRADNKRVVGYGAPAKGNTLLGFLEIGPDTVDYIADRSPLKQGLYTPNAPIPVVSPDRLLEEQPEYVLLLAWNFRDEILDQQAEYRRRGGRFIIPVPEVEIV